MSSRVAAVLVYRSDMSSFLRSIQSLERQTVAVDTITVVDNSDNADLRLINPEGIKIIHPSRNIGFAVGNNIGFARARADFIALINPDAFPHPDWLEKLLDVARRHPNSAAFGSFQLLEQEPEILDGIGDAYHPSGIFRRKGYGRHRAQYGQLQSREIFSPCAAAALYRRDALEAVGGFDEDFFCYGEDVDLGFRLRLAGWNSMLVADAVVRHVGSASSGGQRSDFASYHGHRNMVWVYIKNMPGVLFWLFLPLHILANLVSLIVLTLRGQGNIGLRAKIDAIKGLPKMWQKRQAIQAKRVASIQDIWRALSWRL